MFQDEIVKKRALVEDTIYGHLSGALLAGFKIELNLRELVLLNEFLNLVVFHVSKGIQENKQITTHDIENSKICLRHNIGLRYCPMYVILDVRSFIYLNQDILIEWWKFYFLIR